MPRAHDMIPRNSAGSLTRPMVAILILSTSVFATRGNSAVAQGQVLSSQEGVQTESLAGLRDSVAVLLRRTAVAPGMAVAVVGRGGMAQEMFFGHRDVEAGLPVTANTRFYIASVTKSFTAAAAALTADEGGLELDAPIIESLPSVPFPRTIPIATVSMRDLLRHTAGISSPAVNFATAYAGYDNGPELMALFSNSEPVTRRFRYTNVGYVLAGVALEAATGADWRAAVRGRVLGPLGLLDTGFTLSVDEDPVAVPYASEAGSTRRLRPKSDRVMHAAGGMVSTLPDMARWLRVVMDEGTIDGRTVFPPAVMRELVSSQVHLSGEPSVMERFSGFQRSAYGLGWYLGSYRGERLVQCSGSYAGYRAHLSFMPEQGVGVVVLQNEGKAGVFLPDFVAQEVYDRVLDGGPDETRQTARIETYLELIPAIRGEVAPTDLSRPLALSDDAATTVFEGIYDGGLFGRLHVESRDGGLLARLGELESFLEPAGERSFRVDFTPGMVEGAMTLTFGSTADGPSQTAELSVASGVIFTRVSP